MERSGLAPSQGEPSFTRDLRLKLVSSRCHLILHRAWPNFTWRSSSRTSTSTTPPSLLRHVTLQSKLLLRLVGLLQASMLFSSFLTLSVGCAHAQQLIWQLLNAVEKGFAASGDTDQAFLNRMSRTATHQV